MRTDYPRKSGHMSPQRAVIRAVSSGPPGLVPGIAAHWGLCFFGGIRVPANLDQLLSRLDRCKPAGKDRWQARCPAHEDKNPSLVIGLAQDGRILVHCFAGCGPSDVMLAIGLSLKDLYPEPIAHHLPSMMRRPVTPLNLRQEAQALNRIVDAFVNTGRILDQSVWDRWAEDFVSRVAQDREEGVPVSDADVDLLKRIRAAMLRSRKP